MVDQIPFYKYERYKQPRICQVDQLNCDQAFYLEWIEILQNILDAINHL